MCIYTYIYIKYSPCLSCCVEKNTVKTICILQSLVFVTPAVISEGELHTAGKRKNTHLIFLYYKEYGQSYK